MKTLLSNIWSYAELFSNFDFGNDSLLYNNVPTVAEYPFFNFIKFKSCYYYYYTATAATKFYELIRFAIQLS